MCVCVCVCIMEALSCNPAMTWCQRKRREEGGWRWRGCFVLTEALEAWSSSQEQSQDLELGPFFTSFPNAIVPQSGRQNRPPPKRKTTNSASSVQRKPLLCPHTQACSSENISAFTEFMGMNIFFRYLWSPEDDSYPLVDFPSSATKRFTPVVLSESVTEMRLRHSFSPVEEQFYFGRFKSHVFGFWTLTRNFVIGFFRIS